MSEKNFEVLYLPADFVGLPSASTSINIDVLRAAVLAVMPTDHVIEPLGFNTVRLTASPVPPQSEITAADAAIAAHTGVTTTSALQSLTSDADTSNTTTTYAPKQTSGVDDVFVSQPMNGGAYNLIVTGRVRSSAQVAGVGIGVILRATTAGSISAANEQPHTEDSYASSTIAQLYPMSDIIQLSPGAILRVQFTFKRLGGASGTVTASHVRMRLVAV